MGTQTSELGHLVGRVLAGDMAAYSLLVALTERRVVGVALGILGDSATAQDIAQEVYLKAYRKLHTLTRADAVLAWLTRMTVRLALNKQRSERVRFVEFDESGPEESLASFSSLPTLPSLLTGDDPEDPRVSALERALLTLSPADRTICERFYRGGWSVARLARDAEQSDVAMRKRLSRLRARLKEEILVATTKDYEGPLTGDLSEKIVSLLARPTLTAFPENPVGAVWSRVRAALASFEEITLPETLRLADIAQVVGDARMPSIQYSQHRIDAEHILRSDLSMPLLVEVAKQPRPRKVITTGKAYRDDPVDHRHLQAFHQADILHVGHDVNEWAMAEVLTKLAKTFFSNKKVRFEEIDFPFMCSQAFELSVQVDDEWIEVAAFGRFHDDIAERIGGVGQSAVGAGLGLERFAQLAYGIDDIRKIELARLPFEANG